MKKFIGGILFTLGVLSFGAYSYKLGKESEQDKKADDSKEQEA